eukprot:scpid38052/ scgid31283/ 
MQPTSASTSRRNTLTAGSFTPEPLTRPAEESTAGSITGTTPSQNVNLTVTAVPGDEAGLSSESGPTFLGLVLGTASGAAILALLLALIIVFYIRRRRSRRQKEKASVTSWHDEGLRGDVISSPIDTVRYEATTPHRQGARRGSEPIYLLATAPTNTQVPNIDTLRKTNAASASHSSSNAAAAPPKGAGSSIANEAAYPPLPPEELFDDIVYAQATTPNPSALYRQLESPVSPVMLSPSNNLYKELESPQEFPQSTSPRRQLPPSPPKKAAEPPRKSSVGEGRVAPAPSPVVPRKPRFPITSDGTAPLSDSNTVTSSGITPAALSSTESKPAPEPPAKPPRRKPAALLN